jgi:transcriptional regulator with XRE-family HTH domain
MPDKANLQRFLRAKRARLSLSDVGLPPVANRRPAGLRREEVAELAGMSDTWYARFEAGRAQLSRKALVRVANALVLNSRETNELFRLALAPPDPETRGTFGSGATELHVVRRLFRDVQSASSLPELRTTVVSALMEIAHSPAIVFWLEERRPRGGVYFVSCAGPDEARFFGRYEEPEVMAHFERETLLANSVSENLAESPAEKHREYAALTGSGTYRSVPIQPLDCERSMRIGWASREVGPFPALESAVQDLTGDYARWALGNIDFT